MRCRGAGWFAGLALAVLASPGPSPGAEVACAAVDIRVSADSPALAGRLCTVAAEAVEALGACGLDVPLPLRIDVRQSLGGDCLGLYHCATGRIDLLDPAAFDAVEVDRGPFGVIPAARFYDSIVTHELAHAAYGDRGCPFQTCPVAQEYIAYAMQVRSLPEADRAAFEAWGGVASEEAPGYLNASILAMSPPHFAAAAWWDFSRRAEPCARIRAIVAGDVRLDRPWP